MLQDQEFSKFMLLINYNPTKYHGSARIIEIEFGGSRSKWRYEQKLKKNPDENRRFPGSLRK